MATEEPIRDEPDVVVEEGGANNRNFLIILAALGGLGLLILIAIVAFAFFVLPQQRNARATETAGRLATNAVIQATNEAINAAGTQAAIDQAATASFLATEAARPTDTATPLPTNTATPVPPTETPTVGPTNTPGTPGTPEGGQAGTVTPTPLGTGAAATRTRTPTPLVGALTRTPAATPTALAATGFAEEAGVPGLIIAALGLVAVVVVVRRLRMGLR